MQLPLLGEGFCVARGSVFLAALAALGWGGHVRGEELAPKGDVFFSFSCSEGGWLEPPSSSAELRASFRGGIAW